MALMISMCWQYLTNSIKMKTQKLTLCLLLKHMLQRTQTLFLLAIIFICSVLSLTNIPFFEVNNSNNSEKVFVSYNVTQITSEESTITEDNTMIMGCLVAIIILSLVNTFSFKNRKLQMLLTAFNYLLILLLIALIYNFSLHMDYFENYGNSNFKFGVIFPIILIILNLLAFRGIKKDEQLIRSMDRLR
ncbi:MAG: DUF4293 family protein [Bacteroidetes bacterium]|nr:DUF4293 family protein [Bacteroidota bacterium]